MGLHLYPCPLRFSIYMWHPKIPKIFFYYGFRLNLAHYYSTRAYLNVKKFWHKDVSFAVFYLCFLQSAEAKFWPPGCQILSSLSRLRKMQQEAFPPLGCQFSSQILVICKRSSKHSLHQDLAVSQLLFPSLQTFLTPGAVFSAICPSIAKCRNNEHYWHRVASFLLHYLSFPKNSANSAEIAFFLQHRDAISTPLFPPLQNGAANLLALPVCFYTTPFL